MNANFLVVGLCTLSLGATSYLVFSQGRADAERVAELEARLAAAEKRADAVDALSDQLREVERKLDRGDRGRSSEIRNSDAGAAGPTPVASSSESPNPVPPAKGLDELVADRVEQRMAEKLDALAARDRERGDDGKWKAPIGALAKELALTEEQTAEAKRVFDQAKDDGYVLLKTQRLDGGSILDDFVAALKGGTDPQTATKALFSRVLTEKVPGSDQTYLAEFLAMSQDVDEQLSRRLDAGQMKRLKTLNVSLLEVQTGYDPVGDYVRARLQ